MSVLVESDDNTKYVIRLPKKAFGKKPGLVIKEIAENAGASARIHWFSPRNTMTVTIQAA